MHHITRSIWGIGADFERPTFSPSVLVTSGHYMASHKPGDRCWCDWNRENPDQQVFNCTRCHSFVRDGRIQFLNDSTHALAGQTVDVPDLPDHMKDPTGD
jgi:hypothetical protein